MSQIPTVTPLDRALEPALRAAIDGKAKPPGALGRIEDVAVRLGLIQQRLDPVATRAVLLVFAGDHGLTQAGVSSYPASVTVAMVETLLAGRASANAFARAVGAQVLVVDAGVAADIAPRDGLIGAKIGPGTRNAALEPAMSADQLRAALARGAAIAADLAQGVDVIALGEMGIGNSASAALILHRLGPLPLADSYGLGAGHTPEGLVRKWTALAQACARTTASAPMDVLMQFGGFEIAMMAGAVLGAAAARTPVVVDGFICTAAALAAIRLQPAAVDYCLFAHCSAEAGHRAMLASLEAEPLLDLGLRLGEGTGALLALPLLRAAAGLLSEVASLDDVLAGRL
jgi:nicotinate-nucleotide--dimethylbenzimidazole phosphoribosyltransferase